MKKIILSIIILGASSFLLIKLSKAFFSDTETSKDNLFRAGKVDLLVDSQCSYYRDNRNVGCLYGEDNIPFGTWDSRDLTSEKFFMFDDVKPGDWGEYTLSLTVEDNDAFLCMYVENEENNENELIDPEKEAEDFTLGSYGGELAQNLYFTAWLDQGYKEGWQGKDNDDGEGDNIWQGEGLEPLLLSNKSEPASSIFNNNAINLDKLTAGETKYIGIIWCAGSLLIDETTIECDGSTMGNQSQTDSLSADLSFYIEQARNNESFTCQK